MLDESDCPECGHNPLRRCRTCDSKCATCEHEGLRQRIEFTRNYEAVTEALHAATVAIYFVGMGIDSGRGWDEDKPGCMTLRQILFSAADEAERVLSDTGDGSQQQTDPQAQAIRALAEEAQARLDETRLTNISTESARTVSTDFLQRVIDALSASVSSPQSVEGPKTPEGEHAHKPWCMRFQQAEGSEPGFYEPAEECTCGGDEPRTDQWIVAYGHQCYDAGFKAGQLKSGVDPPTPSPLVREWQPIETAPERRKVFVTWVNASGKRRTALASYWPKGTLEMSDEVPDYHVTDEGTNLDAGWWEESEGNDEAMFRLVEKMTHWMPLPLPPAHAEAALPAQRGTKE